MRIELLWFQGCPSHQQARDLLMDVLSQRGLPLVFEDTDATDPAVAERLRFAGSPTIRVNGIDIDPTFNDSGDYEPRCRLYETQAGLVGVPPRQWLEDAIDAANG